MVYSIGFIGIGSLGGAVCKTLLSKGYRVYVYNRTAAKAEDLVALGAVITKHWSELGRHCDIVFCCTSGAAAVEEIFFSDSGLFEGLSKGTVVIDISTISPRTSILLHEKAGSLGVEYVECPVSGGIEGALSSSLSAIVSCTPTVFNSISDLLNSFCESISYVRMPGAAQELKLLNNIVETINLAGAVEAISIGMRHGISYSDMRKVFTSCRARSAYMNVALDYVADEFRSSGVSLDVRCKDISLALDYFDIKDSGDFKFVALADFVFKSLISQVGGQGDQCAYFEVLEEGK